VEGPHCNALQHIATQRNTLKHSFCEVGPYPTVTNCNTLQHNATRCNTLQHTATHCNTLQHSATRCTTLQHTATHSRIEADAAISSSDQRHLRWGVWVRGWAPARVMHQVSERTATLIAFAKYGLFYRALLQKRHVILRSRATPQSIFTNTRQDEH